jgi:hypothetical protein
MASEGDPSGNHSKLLSGKNMTVITKKEHQTRDTSDAKKFASIPPTPKSGSKSPIG